MIPERLLTGMNKKDLKKFKDILTGRRDEIVSAADAQKDQGIGFSADDLPDEVDLASSEAEQSMNLRLRDRERVLLKKIEKTLKKIDDGTYGVCEQCGEEIGLKRLEARPVTDLCIRCKEEQEKFERSFAE
jgi:DnaK suppressor protein